MRICKDSLIVGFILSFAFFRCQVDRQKLNIVPKKWRRILFYWSMLAGSSFATSLPGQERSIPPHGQTGFIWEVSRGGDSSLYNNVAALISAYETQMETRLVPGIRGKMGIKVDTRNGRGLSTSPELLRAVIEAFETRGFARESILIVDNSVYGLREAGILPSLSVGGDSFEGCPVYALDRELYYEKDWFYDSPLPPSRNQGTQGMGVGANESALLSEGDIARRSFLPAPLLFEVDFWVNLAVVADDPALGIDGVLANATLWNVSNSQRFLASEATASVAIAEIAAIPELNERMLLHFVSLDCYQYIGGPQFNSLYTHSEPLLWMSSDPVAMDRLLFDRINALRRNNGFPEIGSLPRQLPFAASLGLGVLDKSLIQVRKIAQTGRSADAGD